MGDSSSTWCSYGERPTHLEASPHVFFRWWVEVICRAERMACSEEKFLRFGIPGEGKRTSYEVGSWSPACSSWALQSILLTGPVALPRMWVLCHPPPPPTCPPWVPPVLWSYAGTPSAIRQVYRLLDLNGPGESGEEASLFYFSPSFRMYCQILNFHNFVILWLSLRHLPRNGILGSLSMCKSIFRRYYQRVFESGCRSLHT